LQRIIGQDVSVNVISSTGGLVLSVQNIKSAEFQYEREVKSEEYLGQTTKKYDAVFGGITGNIEFHQETASIFTMINAINAATRSRSSTAETFNIVGTFRFQDGSRRVVIPKVQFGAIPISVSGRSEAVSFKLDFSAEDASIIAAA